MTGEKRKYVVLLRPMSSRFIMPALNLLFLLFCTTTLKGQISWDMRYNSHVLEIHDLFGEENLLTPELRLNRSEFLLDSLEKEGNFSFHQRLYLFHGEAHYETGEMEVCKKELTRLMEYVGPDSPIFTYSLFFLTAHKSVGTNEHLDNLFLILSYAKQSESHQLYFDACFLISWYYINSLGQRESAKEWIDRAGETLPLIDNPYNCNIYYTLEAKLKQPTELDQNNRVIWESEQQKTEVFDLLNKAMDCGQVVFETEQPFNNDVSLTIGLLAQLSPALDEEIAYRKKGLELLAHLNYDFHLCFDQLALSSTYLQKGDLDSAHHYIQLAKTYEADSGFYENMVKQRFYQAEYNYYQHKQDEPDSLIKYLKLLSDIQNRMNQENQMVQIEENAARYNTAEKELEIQKQKTELIKKEKRNENLTIISISFILLAIIAVFFFLRIRKRKGQIESMVVQLEDNVKEKTVLIQEVNHRVKNNLQMILAFVDAQERNSTEEETINFSSSIHKRIRSIGLVHELIVKEDRLSGMLIEEYVEELVKEMESLYYSDVLHFHKDFDPIAFNLSTTMYLGILLNELVSNSMKYAGRENEALEIWISLKKTEEGFTLSYKDSGAGIPQEAFDNRQDSKSIGLSLVYSMVRQLRGKLSYNESGENRFVFTFPERSHTMA